MAINEGPWHPGLERDVPDWALHRVNLKNAALRNLASKSRLRVVASDTNINGARQLVPLRTCRVRTHDDRANDRNEDTGCETKKKTSFRTHWTTLTSNVCLVEKRTGLLPNDSS